MACGGCLVLALALMAVAAGTGCVGCTEGQASMTLRVAGNRLIAGNGRPIRLLGVDRPGAEYACVQDLGIIAGPAGERAIAAMKSWRINAVRVPLNEDCWLGINGVPTRYGGARYREMIRRYVARLNQSGLYVLLDLHWSAPGKVRATGQQQMADLDHSPAFWTSVARAFRGDAAAVFDLYNEPYGISWRCWREGCVMPEGWRAAGMQALVNAVRATGARQPIIVSGIDSGNDLSRWLEYRPRDPADQIIAGFHAYNFLSCVTKACWDKTVSPVARSVPVVATEIGEADCAHAFIDRFMSWADAVGVSYLAWGWNPAGCRAPALIRSWNGQPTAYGAGLRLHLRKLHAG